MTYGARSPISTPNPSSIGKLALVRLGAVTHSVNMEQRYVPLASRLTAEGSAPPPRPTPTSRHRASTCSSSATRNGVPSVAKMVRVGNEPTTTITSGPSDVTNDPTPSFSFSSESGTSFECKVDSRSYQPCSPPKATIHLTDGTHTFSVMATDAAGNTDPTRPPAHSPCRRQRSASGARPSGHGSTRSQGQPSDRPRLGLGPAGDGLPQRRLHGVRRPHGRRDAPGAGTSRPSAPLLVSA